MKNKECFKCHLIKPLIDFYKHPQMGDGYLGKCKECAKSDSKERGSDPEYERNRANLPHRIAARRAYQKTERGKEAMRRGRNKYSKSSHGKQVIALRQKDYKKNNPEKHTAHVQVMTAIRSGKLIKKPCEKCGNKKVHAHHDDYSKPLQVIWLCPKCHILVHKMFPRPFL